MRRGFRFLANPYVGLLVGLPSMAGWADWFTAFSRPVAIALVAAGAGLVVLWLVVNRGTIVCRARRVLSATKMAAGAFRKGVGPIIRIAEWADLHSGATFESDRWELESRSLRWSALLRGEGLPALVGTARVKELDGERRLFMYHFVYRDTDTGQVGINIELRTEPSGDPIQRRHALVKVDGVDLSDMTFDPYEGPLVFDGLKRGCIRTGTLALLEKGDQMTVSITDVVVDGKGAEHEFERDVLRVPLRGYRRAEKRLHDRAFGILVHSRRGY